MNEVFKSLLPSLQTFSFTKFSITASMLVGILVMDLIISNLATTINISSEWGIAIFGIIVAAFGIGQYFILDFLVLARENKGSKIIASSSASFRKFNRFVFVTQLLLTAILVYLMVQSALFSHYSTVLLIWSSSISFGLAAIVMGKLAWLFFSWYNVE